MMLMGLEISCGCDPLPPLWPGSMTTFFPASTVRNGGVVTKDVPALLFANGQQTDLIKAAQLAPHRKLLTTPLKVRELRDALVQLLQPEGGGAAAGAPAAGEVA